MEPWEELKSKEEENRVKMIKENPEAPPFHTEKGKFHNLTSNWGPKDRTYDRTLRKSRSITD